MSTKKPNTKIQLMLIAAIIAITAVIATILLLSNSSKKQDSAEMEEAASIKKTDDGTSAGESEHGHEDNEGIALTQEQVANQQIKIQTAALGPINRTVSLPGRLMVNSDQQAHLSPNFAGRVEAVYVQTGQNVTKGQRLATLLVPELVELQANIRLMQSRLDLAKTNYERERSLWRQGISAKQDYLLAENQYKQAQIEVSSAQAKVNAYGGAGQGMGRYDLKSPITGVINNKDVLVGENVQTTTQLFQIDRLDQLWLEFVVPAQLADQLTQDFNQQANVSFTAFNPQQTFKAKLLTLTPSADMQTGRLIARAVVDNTNLQLRPNMMVNVQIAQKSNNQSVHVVVKADALQQIEGKDVIFIAEKNKDGMRFVPRPITIGAKSTDQQWIAIQEGLKQGQAYVSEGSVVLKSELEKGEAEHDH